MIFQQSDLNEDVEGERRGFGLVPLSPSSALRAPSPSREKVFLRFLKQWILQLRVNPSCRMTWGWGESGRRNSSLKYAATNGTIRTAPVQNSTHESIKNQCTQCQHPMYTASTANAHGPRLPNARFLQHEDFHSVQYSSHPLSFCAEPKAKS